MLDVNYPNLKDREKEDKKMTVLKAWNKRREMRTKSDRLFDEGCRLRVESNKLYDTPHVKGIKLFAEGNKLFAEGDKLRIEGDIIFYNAIIENLGDVEIKWEGNDAIVNWVKYEWKPKASDSCEGKVVEIEGKKYKLIRV